MAKAQFIWPGKPVLAEGKAAGWRGLLCACSVLALTSVVVPSGGFAQVIEAPSASGALKFDDTLVDAADQGNLTAVKSLVESGKFVDSRGKFQTTPLMRAASQNHIEVLEYLLRSGANPNLQDVGGATALHLAARHGNARAVDALIRTSANPNVQDKEGWTPLMRAALYNHEDAAAELVTGGADVNRTNAMGESALQHAVFAGNEPITRLLVERGADLKHTDRNGLTAADIAFQRGSENITALLVHRPPSEPAETSMPNTSAPVEIPAPTLSFKAPAFQAPEKSPTSETDPLFAPMDSAPAKPAAEPEVHVSRGTPPPSLPSVSASPEPTAMPMVSDEPAKARSFSGVQYLLQLGTFGSRRDAKEHWNALVSAHPDLLGGLELVISEVTLQSNQRTVYRTQAGFLENRNVADKRCGELFSRKVDCFVVESAEAGDGMQSIEPIPDSMLNPAMLAPVEPPPAFEPVPEPAPPAAAAEPVQEQTPQAEPMREPAPADHTFALPHQAPADIEPPPPAPHDSKPWTEIPPPALPEPAADTMSAAPEPKRVRVAAPDITPPPPAPPVMMAAPEPMPTATIRNLADQTPPPASEGFGGASMEESTGEDKPRLAWLHYPPNGAEPAPMSAAPMELGSDDIGKSAASDVVVSEAIRVPLSSQTEPEEPPLSERVPLPSRDTRQGTDWVQFRGFASETEARAFWNRLSQEKPELANGLRFKVTQGFARFTGTPLSVRVGPVRDQAALDALCEYAEDVNDELACLGMKETGQSGAIRTSRDPRPVTESKPVSEQRRIVALADEAAYKQVPIAHWVMLGSFRSKDEAEAEWDMLRSLHPQILDSYSPLVAAPRYSSSAEPLVRLKIGPFAEQAYAMRMCHDLQQRGTECLSVRE